MRYMGREVQVIRSYCTEESSVGYFRILLVSSENKIL